jgi:hypothetical protein
MAVFTKYRGQDLAGSAKESRDRPAGFAKLSSLLSQTMCTSVSHVVKPDGDNLDEPR